MFLYALLGGRRFHPVSEEAAGDTTRLTAIYR
jgi:hypothetical protein